MKKLLVAIVLLAALVVQAGEIPDKYDMTARHRKLINGETVDLGEAIKWHNQNNYWSSITSDRNLSLNSPKYKNAFAELKKLDVDRQKWHGYLISGRVLQVLDNNALLLDGGVIFQDKTSMLLNYPKTVVDDDYVSTIAVSVGTTNYVNVMGARSTVRLYDYGVVIKK